MQKMILAMIFFLSIYQPRICASNNFATAAKKRIMSVLSHITHTNIQKIDTEDAKLLADYNERVKKEIGTNKGFKVFVEKFSPPPGILKQLLINEKKILKEMDIDLIFFRAHDYGYKDFVLKPFKADRIILAERMRKYIQQQGFQSIGIPQKYLFLAGNPWIIVAQRINRTMNDVTISLQQLQELGTFIEEMGYRDITGDNIIIDKNNRFFFVDTESDSCQSVTKKSLCFDKYYNMVALRNCFVANMGQTTHRIKLENQAREWLDKEIERLKNKYELSPEKCKKVIDRGDLDDSDINLKDILKYLKEYQEKQSRATLDRLDKEDYDAKAQIVPSVADAQTTQQQPPVLSKRPTNPNPNRGMFGQLIQFKDAIINRSRVFLQYISTFGRNRTTR